MNPCFTIHLDSFYFGHVFFLGKGGCECFLFFFETVSDFVLAWVLLFLFLYLFIVKDLAEDHVFLKNFYKKERQ
jgi:hypothetical protein